MTVGVVGVVGTTVAGWLLERPGGWWSSDAAIAVWTAGNAVVATVVAGFWGHRPTVGLGAVALGGAVALAFLGGVAVRAGISDDALGLAVALGFSTITAFGLGRWIRARVLATGA